MPLLSLVLASLGFLCSEEASKPAIRACYKLVAVTEVEGFSIAIFIGFS